MVGYKIDKWVDSSNSKWKYIIAFDGIVQTECEDPLMDIDCGTNIALFKAIAAINDENDYMQWFTDIRGDYYECKYYILPERLRLANYMKATTTELIEHFKNK